jgi:DNA repair exonuclease SbcCD nuclease subunit
METEKNKILCIGDLHMKDFLSYSDYIKDNRVTEEQEVLEFIVKQASDCSSIVFMGDQLNGRINPPQVIKKLVNFLERFENKELIILAGNHEKSGDGKSAIDFLKEVKNKRWIIVSDNLYTLGHKVFCPYFTKAELEAKDNKDATSKIMKKIKDNPGTILFIHHIISDSLNAGIKVNLFPEAVLPKKKLEELYKLVIGGHIHTPQEMEKIIVTGSVFNNEVGETEKYIWKLNEKTLKAEKIKLPGRGVYKFENPTDKDLKIPKESIIKVTITKKMTIAEINELKEKLKKFDAYILLEHLPKERKKIHLEDDGNMLEFDIPQLLKIYAEEKKVDINKLKQAFELIR